MKPSGSKQQHSVGRLSDGSPFPLARATLLLIIILMPIGRSQAAPPRLVSGTVEGVPVEGLALIRTVDRCILLADDGKLHDFDPRASGNALAVKEGRFTPVEAMDLRVALQEEFGRDFEVRSTGHFLVVQPRGVRQKWPEIFEALHRSFTGYFSVRGVRVLDGNFPLVAIVMPDQASFMRHLHRMKVNVNADVLGIYDRASNRIVMYNHEHGGDQLDSTIRHEAAHQSAFNSGVHSRVVETPHWIVEGIGCLFQAEGISGGRGGGRAADRATDRCDPQMRRLFLECYEGDNARLVADLNSLISGDQMFRERATIKSAYALSWGLVFYLSERRGDEFAELLRVFGNRAPFDAYPSQQRIAEFESIVGPIDDHLGSQLSRYLQQF